MPQNKLVFWTVADGHQLEDIFYDSMSELLYQQMRAKHLDVLFYFICSLNLFLKKERFRSNFDGSSFFQWRPKTLDINFFAGRGSSASMRWGIGRIGGGVGGEREPEVLGVGGGYRK